MSDISVIGLGPMGTALAKTLQASGHQVTVWNRTRKKIENLSRRPKTRSHSATALDMTVRQCVMMSGNMVTPRFKKTSRNALRSENADAKRPTRAAVAVWEQ